MIAARFPVVLVLLVAVGACGATQREKTLRTTYTVLNAVSEGVVTYSREKQDAIVTGMEAGTIPLEQGKARIAEFRKSRDVLWHRLLVAYDLLGKAFAFDDVSVASVTAAALAVQQAYAELRKGSP